MKRRAPARAGAVILVFVAACSSHVDVGLSRDGGAPPPPKIDGGDAGDAAMRPETGVTRADPSIDTMTWVQFRRLEN